MRNTMNYYRPGLLIILFFTMLLFISHSVSAQSCNTADITATAPDSRFVVIAQEVKDNKTGLIWQKCSLGQSGSDCSGSAVPYTWSAALQAAEDERLQTGLQWRLPDIKELRSIIEYQCYGPAINLTVFPNTRTTYYWSASSYANSSYKAWYVDFYDGSSSIYFNMNHVKYVRLVRAGQ